MKLSTSTLVHLQQRRLQSLKKAKKAREAHRGQRLAQRDAAKATHCLLRAELQAQKAAVKNSSKPAPMNDLFSLEIA